MEIPDRWAERCTPAAGLLFIALVLIGGPVLIGGSSPAADAPGGAVSAFYADHQSRQRAGAVLLAFAFAAFLFFAGSLRGRWRRHDPVETWGTIAVAAAAVLVAGQTANASMTWALTNEPAKLAPATAQTLNVLSHDLVLTSAVGYLVFGLASGLAIIRGKGLPAWLGWAAIAIGVAFVTPVEFAAFILLLVWIAVLSVLTLRQPH
jgi:hypothetical protein